MDSVEKDHVRDGMHETPTVYASPHDSDNNLSDNDDLEIENVRPTVLSDRAPSVEHVLKEAAPLLRSRGLSNSSVFLSLSQTPTTPNQIAS